MRRRSRSQTPPRAPNQRISTDGGLLFPEVGKILFKIVMRTDFAYVRQRRRFPDDEEFWVPPHQLHAIAPSAPAPSATARSARARPIADEFRLRGLSRAAARALGS